MAPGRSDLGRLAILAIAALLLLAGCGGGSSSSAPTGGGSTESSSSADTGAEEAAGTSAEEGGSDGGKSKQGHAPVEVPEGPAEEGPSKSQKAQVPTANVELEVPSAPATPGASGTLPAANTCPGKSPEITWKSIPENTSELQLYVMNLAPVNGKLYFDYALAGVDPSLEGLKAGEVPGGAVVAATAEPAA